MTGRVISVVLWLIFAAALTVAGLVLIRACGTGWPFLNFCAGYVSEGQSLLLRHSELRVERESWQARLRNVPQCLSPARRAQIDCQPQPTDETLVLVDVSNSMGWDYSSDVYPELTRLHAELAAAPDPFRRILLNAQVAQMSMLMDTPAKPDRLDVAREALMPLMDGMRADATIKLLSFAECRRGPRLEGTFSANDTASYRASVDGLSLRNDTALAESIAALAGQTEAGRTADRPVNIVIVSDGEDNCGGDPCAAAAGLRRQLPHAHVSVVSLAPGLGANACIAEATDGLFLTATDVEDLRLRMRQTTGQLSAQECRALGPMAPQLESTE